MNREQKSAVIDEIAAQITESEAVYAVDYRGISVAQAAELRGKLRDADATLRVVKNTLTIRAADQAGTENLKPLLTGPTALTFARGDAASAAKAVFDYARTTGLLPFKGGVLNGDGAQPRAGPVDRPPAHARRPQRAVREHRRLAAHRPRDEPLEPHQRPRPSAQPGGREDGVRRDPVGRGARERTGGRARGRAAPEAERPRPSPNRHPSPRPQRPPSPRPPPSRRRTTPHLTLTKRRSNPWPSPQRNGSTN